MQQSKSGCTSAVGKASFSLNVREILNGLSYISITLVVQKEGSFEYTSGASEKFLSSCPL